MPPQLLLDTVRLPGCLDEETIVAFVQGTLAAPHPQAVLEHLKGCADCSTVLAELAKSLFDADASARGSAGGEAPADLLRPGARVSRYEITRPVGRGGGGIVYEAFDPQLKRRVALKLVRPDLFPELSPDEARARLLREAETMARLVHPNVVAVHDAGTLGDQVFIVMDFVAGETLGQWLARKRRGWRAIVQVFTAAGRGLQAAHGEAIVHRDFKPDNVLVGDKGQVLVTDFGLARGQDK